MILTPTGERLLAYAEKIIYLLDEADKAIKDSCEPSGTLTIGASNTISSIRLPELLAKYHKSYPKVDLSLITNQSEELIYKINHFQLDGAFVKTLSINDDNIEKELVFEENLVLISHPKYRDIESIYCKPFLMNIIGCPNRIQLDVFISKFPSFCNSLYCSSVKSSIPIAAAISTALFFGLFAFLDSSASLS